MGHAGDEHVEEDDDDGGVEEAVDDEAEELGDAVVEGLEAGVVVGAVAEEGPEHGAEGDEEGAELGLGHRARGHVRVGEVGVGQLHAVARRRLVVPEQVVEGDHEGHEEDEEDHQELGHVLKANECKQSKVYGGFTLMLRFAT